MAQQDDLAERYGAPSPLRRPLVIVGSVLVASIFLGWLAWSALVHADPDVSSELVGFTIEDEHIATARVDVRLNDDDVVATCVLRAIAEDHTVVGEVSFEVGASDLDAGNDVVREIRTERRATSVESIGCTTEDQQRPR